jgi:hypothetical protein
LVSQENVPSLSASQPNDGPPKPPRSAFMCFADARKDEIMRSGDEVTCDDNILALVATEWRNLEDSVRASWDEVARDDKVRYVREKAEYKGPWVAPKRRAKKHPLAPKRPASAFLAFSQNRRAMIKEQNPDMGNTDVSRLLGEMWRNASEAERRPYVDQELLERAEYNETIKKFREQQAHLDVASRTSHRAVKKIAESRHHHHAAPPPHLTYDPFSQFEPLRIHSAEEAANKVDDQAMLSPHQNTHYKSNPNTDKSRQRPMFRHHERRDERYPQPLYHHQVPAFRPGTYKDSSSLLMLLLRLRSQSCLSCTADGQPPAYQATDNMPRSQMAPDLDDSPMHYGRASSRHGSFSFPESSYYHYP